jgi:hypothetical protein
MTLLRVVATLLLVGGWTVHLPATAVAAEPNLADLCSLMPPELTVYNAREYAYCTATKPSQEGPLLSTVVNIYGWADPVAIFQGQLGNIPSEARTPTDAYGEEAYEGGDGTTYHALFRRAGYVVDIDGWDEDRADIAAIARQIDANILTALSSVPSATPLASPAASDGALTMGMGCATDLRFVRCTASVGDAPPDADLVFEWLFDGVTRPESGSTMQIDWIAEGVRTGNHFVLVTVRDARHPNVGGAAASTSFELGMSLSLACSYETGAGDYAVLCTATPSNVFANAVLEYDWSYIYIDSVGAQRSGTDGSKSERFSRSFGRGAVTVSVLARDTVNGVQSSPVSYFVAIDPAATVTELLTGGQTADPQNVIDALLGAAGGAAATAAVLAMLAGLFGGAGAGGSGSVVTGTGPRTGAGATPAAGATAGSGADASAGAGTGTAASGLLPDDPYSVAADLLAGQPDELPPITPETIDQWKALTGWPAEAHSDDAFRRGIEALQQRGINPNEILEALRADAAFVRRVYSDVRLDPPKGGTGSGPGATGPAPKPRDTGDAANLLSVEEWLFDDDPPPVR